jgi:acylphosphatase
MPEIYLRIVGKVQGVGFRWYVRERAVALGLAGWVRNTRNGDVELVARGESEALDDLMSAVARGPRSANVAAVHREPVDSDASYPSPFTIET